MTTCVPAKVPKAFFYPPSEKVGNRWNYELMNREILFSLYFPIISLFFLLFVGITFYVVIARSVE